MKRIAAFGALFFAVISLFYAAQDIARAGKANDLPALAGEPDGLYVVLFRGSAFCPTCDLMEKLSRELLEDDEQREGEIGFRTINFELSGNEHFLLDYDLYTTTIVLIRMEKGEEIAWRNLQDSWEHAEKTGDFKEYLSREIESFDGKTS